MTEMGERWKGISLSAISENMKRLEARLRKDSRLHDRFQRVLQGLGSKISQIAFEGPSSLAANNLINIQSHSIPGGDYFFARFLA